MNIRTPIFLFALYASALGCRDSGNKKEGGVAGADIYHTVSIDGNYRLDLPNFMTGTTGLNEEASLQYQSLLKEAYLLVIDEPKADFEEVYRVLEQYDDELSVLQNYRDARLQILSRTTEINNKSEPQSLRINGLDAETVELDAIVNGMDNEIAYFLTFVEGEDNVYMIMAWTLKDKKIEHKKTFKTIAESFELID
ncbi:MAG: hypothetical protein ACX93O_06405 [Flagellimonas sp.]